MNWRSGYRFPFYQSEDGNIRLFSATQQRIDRENWQKLNYAVKSIANPRLRIELSCKSIDDDGLEAFRRMLLHNTTLHSIRLPSCEFSSYGFKRLCKFLERNSGLKLLVLPSAKLKDNGLDRLLELMQKAERFRLNAELTEEQWIRVFRTYVDKADKLQYFVLPNSRLTEASLDSLCQLLSKAEPFSLGISHLNNERLAAFSESMSKNKKITNLYLPYLPLMSIEAMKALCNMLEHNNQLEYLSIESREHAVGQESIINLFEALTSNTTAQRLSLYNQATDQSLNGLVRMLKENTTCTMMGIKLTPCNTDKLWSALAEDTMMTRLQLRSVPMVEGTVEAVSEFIKSNVSLETLDLGRATGLLTTEPLQDLLTTLLENPTWKDVQLRGVILDDSTMCILTNLIETNHTLNTLVLAKPMDVEEVEELCQLLLKDKQFHKLWLHFKYSDSSAPPVDYIRKLQDTNLESFTCEADVEDDVFNMVISIVTDNKRIQSVELFPDEYKMEFTYRPVEDLS